MPDQRRIQNLKRFVRKLNKKIQEAKTAGDLSEYKNLLRMKAFIESILKMYDYEEQLTS